MNFKRPMDSAKREHVGICMLMMAALAGCSETCVPSAPVGLYTMKAAANTYVLRLKEDGSGSLSRNGQTDEIRWEWANEQVFLHLSRERLENLSELIGQRTPPDAANFHSGYFGLDPVCRSGQTTELNLGENAARFSRTN